MMEVLMGTTAGESVIQPQIFFLNSLLTDENFKQFSTTYNC